MREWEEPDVDDVREELGVLGRLESGLEQTAVIAGQVGLVVDGGEEQICVA